MQIRLESGVPKPVASDKNSAEILSNLFISARTKKPVVFLRLPENWLIVEFYEASKI